MYAVTVAAVGDHIGLTQFPVDHPFPDILFAQGQGQLAAGRPAELETVFAINLGSVLKPVFANLELLHGHGHPSSQILLPQLLRGRLLPGLNFFPI